MAKHYPQEFREDVVAVARRREPGVTLKQIAEDFGVSDASLSNWLRQADIEDGKRPGLTDSDQAENGSCASGFDCWSRRTRCCGGLQRICLRRT